MAFGGRVLHFAMAKAGSAKRHINLRLLHDGVQPGTPLNEPLRFVREVHRGLKA